MSADFAWYFLSLKSRISRQEFWLGYAGASAILFLLKWKLEDISFYNPTGRVRYSDDIDMALALPKLVAAGILIWPLSAIYVKRLHDLNLSGWWLLFLTAISAVTTITSTDRWNVIFSAAIIILGLIPGTRGSNRFGADPSRTLACNQATRPNTNPGSRE
jgi:uncharacterized membrane protein YhaH (DUF805 family)